ncbi:hypothetical protein JR316_0005824 [Psilocybe cubensis]|uniref:Uncharacterized protein n=1 Tax=Psilocybe cubensis TaxID=181762 RepID=A0ACB8H0Y7_PSICU|nr:hypothetical protein JR316_0005824 [Psilocybe cubensis]KAH9481302.1 hypothetical protein JR316_0005824 [Psilocybe cubensis]
MPISFKVADHSANTFTGWSAYNHTRECQNADDLLAASWGLISENNKYNELLQSSFGSGFKDIMPQRNGYVNTAVHANNRHQTLVSRPDDVWIAILGQFNFYVNANAEKLRSSFVKHEGKKRLEVRATGDRYTVDFGDLAHQMTSKILENVVDKRLESWILPNFSTTTFNDIVVCSVLMMATLKAYFSYVFILECGIPSRPLEGTKLDRENLLARVDKLDTFGEEPKAWAILLRFILRKFVLAFEDEHDPEFWSRICHFDSGSDSQSVSGWITAFCVWDSKGIWQGPDVSETLNSPPEPIRDNIEENRFWFTTNMDLELSTIPVGFCEVDVLLIDNGVPFDCMMVSGHVATRIQGRQRDTVSPSSGWFMFIKHGAENHAKLMATTKAMEL